MDAQTSSAAPSTADRMSMSLDDCIKARKTETKKQKPDPKKAAKPAKKPQNKAVDKSQNAKKKSPNAGVAKPNNLGAKPDTNGGISKKPAPGSRAARRAAKRAASVAVGGSAASTPVVTSRVAQPSAPAPASSPTAGCRVSVSNLNAGVSEEDIRELFGAVGPLVSAHVKLENRGGRQERCAEVVFAEMSHALEAITRYNNVPLDDMPLKISLSTTRGTRGRPIRGRGGYRHGGK